MNCTSKRREKINDILRFDGSETITIDSLLAAKSLPMQLTLKEGIYQVITAADTIYFFNNAVKSIWLSRQSIDSLRHLTDEFNWVLGQLKARFAVVEQQKSKLRTLLDSLNTFYAKRQLTYKLYQQKKDSITSEMLKMEARYKHYIMGFIERNDIGATDIPAYLLLSSPWTKRVYNFTADSSIFIQVANGYQRLPLLSDGQKMFISYVSAYRQYSSEGRMARERVSPGQLIDELVLPDKNGRFISLRRICQQRPLTLLLIVRNSCHLCNEEREYLKARYLQYRKSLEIYEVSIDDVGPFANWVSVIQKHTFDWIQVKDTSAISNKLLYDFALSATPGSILLEKNGFIVAHNPSRKYIDSIIKFSHEK